ncbi:probable LRR receptor-like serine/threonine-protein kinase At1g51810 [Triticum urartu]|uniref:probable LRR receptor-like serine/threonine-protein kinase At1g51810 n=1 Tax=Triticum urartu TaxID=4572 RepID=UPI0020436E8F|nr:probable LRR receptor-like serine/threonine-protein kinase At1g51810 [Triticum urartu]
MRVPGAWRISVGGVPMPPPPTGAARRAEIARIRASLPSSVCIGDSTPASGRLVLVAHKPEPGLPPEYEEIARRGFSDDDALWWARDDYLRDEMVRQRQTLEKIAARKHQSGFLSIDCGLDAKFSGRKDTYTNIAYISDSPYVDGGENHRVAADQESFTNDVSLLTLRSFPPPSGLRNCYNLPTESGAKYLVRMEFFHGRYDGKSSPLSLQFELHLGTNYWDTVTLQDTTDDWVSEAIFVAWSSWVTVCLLNTGTGTPFVNTVELRPLGASLYPDVTIDESISTYGRGNMGGNFTRYGRRPEDLGPPQKRQGSQGPAATFLSGAPGLPGGGLRQRRGVKGGEKEAAALGFPDDPYDRYWGSETSSSWANLSTKEHIQQDDNSVAVPILVLQTAVSPINNVTVLNVGTWRAYKRSFEFKFFLHFTDIQNTQLRLFDLYVNDDQWLQTYSPPYLAISYMYSSAWNKTTDGKYNITLAASPTSVLPPMINAYEVYNNIPHDTPRTSTKDCEMPPLLLFIYFHTLVQPVSTHDPPKESELQSALGSTKSHGDHLQNTENRRFTYMELQKFTNKFERFIGQGGFGLVYYGRLEDNSEVAVKMRSESSSHGLDEFLAEVHSLTTVHHRNLVSLVGYCWEKDHLALVYEYMPRGNLCDHLRGLFIHCKSKLQSSIIVSLREYVIDCLLFISLKFSGTCLICSGLDYLHKGCSLPIIHRDVKTSNILLGQNLRAKIADFGLCKTYLSETQTHISTNAAGSAGYFDPEYVPLLTESSDVYSFGVVLLEIATGEPPILPGHGHIVQRMKQKMATGNITSVADARLGGAYEVTSMWKLVDTAIACTADAAVGRPTMAAVVAQLKESIALEEARVDSAVRVSPVSDTVALVSTFSPSAR